MVQEPFAQPEYREGIDADAVCGQCGSVNPEGTLICKTCGNNLRDQRMLRMTADQMLDAEIEGKVRSTFLAKALPVLGLLFLLWFALNAGRMASLMTSADTNQEYQIVTNPHVFWDGPDRAIYDALQQDLLKRFPTPADAEAARAVSNTATGISEGIYAVYERQGSTEKYVGAAIVKAQDGVWHYAAKINSIIEIRGMAIPMEQSLNSQWDEGGIQHDGSFYALNGVAVLRNDGIVLITGQTDYNNVARYQSVAYRVAGI